MILNGKFLNEVKVSKLIEVALEDQKNDFHAQIRGLFNIITHLSKRIESLENKICDNSFVDNQRISNHKKNSSKRNISTITKCKAWR